MRETPPGGGYVEKSGDCPVCGSRYERLLDTSELEQGSIDVPVCVQPAPGPRLEVFFHE